MDAQRPAASSDRAGQAAGGLSSADSGQDVGGCVVTVPGQTTILENHGLRTQRAFAAVLCDETTQHAPPQWLRGALDGGVRGAEGFLWVLLWDGQGGRLVASSKGGGQRGEARQRGKRREGIARVEAGHFGSCCGDTGRRLRIGDGATAGSARQERGGRFEDAGAGPGLLDVVWAEREGRSSPSESRGRCRLVNRQGDGAACSISCVAAGSAFTKSVQEFGEGGGRRGPTDSSGTNSSSLRAFVIRIHARTSEG